LKTYINKLYSIPNAAKRAGITEEAIKEMITYHVIMANIQFNVAYIWGGDIPGLKAKWEEWVTKKDKMKKVDVTMLRMEEGE